MQQSVIVAGRRSPIGRYLGSLSKMRSPELAAAVARAVLNETDAASQGVDEVIVGCVLKGGLGQNPARQVALKAGLADTVTASSRRAESDQMFAVPPPRTGAAPAHSWPDLGHAPTRSATPPSWPRPPWRFARR